MNTINIVITVIWGYNYTDWKDIL